MKLLDIHEMIKERKKGQRRLDLFRRGPRDLVVVFSSN